MKLSKIDKAKSETDRKETYNEQKEKKKERQAES